MLIIIFLIEILIIIVFIMEILIIILHLCSILKFAKHFNVLTYLYKTIQFGGDRETDDFASLCPIQIQFMSKSRHHPCVVIGFLLEWRTSNYNNSQIPIALTLPLRPYKGKRGQLLNNKHAQKDSKYMHGSISLFNYFCFLPCP